MLYDHVRSRRNIDDLENLLMYPTCWWLSEKQSVLTSVASLVLDFKYEFQVW